MAKILSVNVRCYPSEDGNEIRTTAVLVEGSVGDYAVYVGHGSPEFVAAYGDKIRFEEAEIQFSPLVRERYRD